MKNAVYPLGPSFDKNDAYVTNPLVTKFLFLFSCTKLFSSVIISGFKI